MYEKQLSITSINFVQLVMAKQISIVNFLTKSSLCTAEADLSSISKSSSSQIEEAKQTAQKKKPVENPNKTLAKVGHDKLFGSRATDTNKRFGEK